MCGIVGAISKNRNVLPILITGLKNLEYRGYDSAGVAYLKNNKINIVAIVYVLKFFLAISNMAVSYLLLLGLSLYTIQRTEI